MEALLPSTRLSLLCQPCMPRWFPRLCQRVTNCQCEWATPNKGTHQTLALCPRLNSNSSAHPRHFTWMTGTWDYKAFLISERKSILWASWFHLFSFSQALHSHISVLIITPEEEDEEHNDRIPILHYLTNFLLLHISFLSVLNIPGQPHTYFIFFVISWVSLLVICLLWDTTVLKKDGMRWDGKPKSWNAA